MLSYVKFFNMITTAFVPLSWDSVKLNAFGVVHYMDLWLNILKLSLGFYVNQAKIFK